MEKCCTKTDANIYLQRLIDCPLQYGIKSYDMDLYDLGFGEIADHPSFAIHTTGEIKLIQRRKDKRVKRFNEASSYINFYQEIRPLIGLHVERIALSDKNDLWLDLNEYWIVCITREDQEESWRFFEPRSNSPHLIAADTWLEMNYQRGQGDGLREPFLKSSTKKSA